ncbi:MAG: sulfatase, partial [Pirellulaceae bacterium]
MPRFLSLVIGTLVGLLICSSDASAEKPNVLFIAVDDLRPELNCYGKSHIHSPNIDRLAAQGTLFERAYCMVPTCGASRASLMTGIRPAPNRFVGYLARADKDAPGMTTLNTHFKNAGYRTLSQGKIFHNPADNAKGWSQPAWRPQQGSLAYQLDASRKAQKENTQGRGRGPAYESAAAPDEDYADGQIALQAIDQLRELKERDEPFFLAVGFFKPHLPFVCPQKYWDLYDADQIELPETYHRPQNAPGAAIHTSGELRSYAGIPAKGPVSDETAKQMIHGYYACVSFIDAQVGKILNELEQLGLAEDTIVVFWGDHGWSLGEHTLW